MPDTNLLEKLPQLKEKIESCPPAQQSVAQLLLRNPELFSRLPIADIASKANVSKPTVIRFCRHCGAKGLPDFKVIIIKALSSGVPFIHQFASSTDKEYEILQKIFDNTINGINKLRSQISFQSLELASELLFDCFNKNKKLNIFGVGNSGIVAKDAEFKFFRLNCNVTAYSDSHQQIMAATLMNPDDCAIFISNSGQMRDLLETLSILKKNKVPTIAITTKNSTLAHKCDVSILCNHSEDSEIYSPMVSRILHLIIIDYLVTNLSIKLDTIVLPNLMKIKNNLNNKRVKE